jgi:hypothetical protein
VPVKGVIDVQQRRDLMGKTSCNSKDTQSHSSSSWASIRVIAQGSVRAIARQAQAVMQGPGRQQAQVLKQTKT